MWSSLTGAGSSVPSASVADAIESVRILVVGDAGKGCFFIFFFLVSRFCKSKIDGATHPSFSLPFSPSLLPTPTGCGKTSLVQALVQGSAPARPVPTVACSVQVKVRIRFFYLGFATRNATSNSSAIIFPRPLSFLPNQTKQLIECAADDSSQPRQFFVELWDVGGGRRAAPLRRLFYGDAAGVLLCHDLSRRGGSSSGLGLVGSLLSGGGGKKGGDSSPGKGGGNSSSSSSFSSSPAEKAASRAARLNVRAWAAEVAAQGSFRSSVAGVVGAGGASVAPSPSMHSMGGGASSSSSSQAPLLPVPALLVGTKADADPTRW